MWGKQVYFGTVGMPVHGTQQWRTTLLINITKLNIIKLGKIFFPFPIHSHPQTRMQLSNLFLWNVPSAQSIPNKIHSPAAEMNGQQVKRCSKLRVLFHYDPRDANIVHTDRPRAKANLLSVAQGFGASFDALQDDFNQHLRDSRKHMNTSSIATLKTSDLL